MMIRYPFSFFLILLLWNVLYVQYMHIEYWCLILSKYVHTYYMSDGDHCYFYKWQGRCILWELEFLVFSGKLFAFNAYLSRAQWFDGVQKFCSKAKVPIIWEVHKILKISPTLFWHYYSSPNEIQTAENKKEMSFHFRPFLFRSSFK